MCVSCTVRAPTCAWLAKAAVVAGHEGGMRGASLREPPACPAPIGARGVERARCGGSGFKAGFRPSWPPGHPHAARPELRRRRAEDHRVHSRAASELDLPMRCADLAAEFDEGEAEVVGQVAPKRRPVRRGRPETGSSPHRHRFRRHPGRQHRAIHARSCSYCSGECVAVHMRTTMHLARGRHCAASLARSSRRRISSMAVPTGCRATNRACRRSRGCPVLPELRGGGMKHLPCDVAVGPLQAMATG